MHFKECKSGTFNARINFVFWRTKWFPCSRQCLTPFMCLLCWKWSEFGGTYHEIFENAMNNNSRHKTTLWGLRDSMNLRHFSDHRCAPLRSLQAKFRKIRELSLLKKMVVYLIDSKELRRKTAWEFSEGIWLQPTGYTRKKAARQTLRARQSFSHLSWTD